MHFRKRCGYLLAALLAVTSWVSDNATARPTARSGFSGGSRPSSMSVWSSSRSTTYSQSSRPTYTPPPRPTYTPPQRQYPTYNRDTYAGGGYSSSQTHVTNQITHVHTGNSGGGGGGFMGTFMGAAAGSAIGTVVGNHLSAPPQPYYDRNGSYVVPPQNQIEPQQQGGGGGSVDPQYNNPPPTQMYENEDVTYRTVSVSHGHGFLWFLLIVIVSIIAGILVAIYVRIWNNTKPKTAAPKRRSEVGKMFEKRTSLFPLNPYMLPGMNVTLPKMSFADEGDLTAVPDAPPGLNEVTLIGRVGSARLAHLYVGDDNTDFVRLFMSTSGEVTEAWWFAWVECLTGEERRQFVDAHYDRSKPRARQLSYANATWTAVDTYSPVVTEQLQDDDSNTIRVRLVEELLYRRQTDAGVTEYLLIRDLSWEEDGDAHLCTFTYAGQAISPNCVSWFDRLVP